MHPILLQVSYESVNILGTWSRWTSLVSEIIY